MSEEEGSLPCNFFFYLSAFSPPHTLQNGFSFHNVWRSSLPQDHAMIPESFRFLTHRIKLCLFCSSSFWQTFVTITKPAMTTHIKCEYPSVYQVSNLCSIFQTVTSLENDNKKLVIVFKQKCSDILPLLFVTHQKNYLDRSNY